MRPRAVRCGNGAARSTCRRECSRRPVRPWRRGRPPKLEAEQDRNQNEAERRHAAKDEERPQEGKILPRHEHRQRQGRRIDQRCHRRQGNHVTIDRIRNVQQRRENDRFGQHVKPQPGVLCRRADRRPCPI